MNVDSYPIRVLSLFSGVHGLGLGIRIALPGAVTICHVEIEVAACEVLAARMAEGTIEPAPILTDITRFDGRPWRGRVDLIEGGFPCIDLSVAGKQAGIHGEHSGLWFEYLRIIREVEPRWVFIENVPAVIAFPAGGIVLGGLAQGGFDAEWLSIRASDVGASHGRNRVFVLAYKPGVRWGEGWAESEGIKRGSDVSERGGAMAQSDRAGFESRLRNDPTAGHRGSAESEGGASDRAMDDALRSERWPLSRSRDRRSEGIDTNREANSGAGITDEVLGDPDERHDDWSGSARPERRGESPDANGQMGNSNLPRLEGRSIEGCGLPNERITGETGDSELYRISCNCGCTFIGILSDVCPECRTIGSGHTNEVEPGDIRGSILADAGLFDDERSPAGGREAEYRTEYSREELADDDGGGCGIRTDETESEQAGRSRARVLEGRYADIPLFAPGPGATELWQELLVRYPELRPAISQEETESVLRGVANGSSDQFDFEDRTDRLRAVGNMVCPLQAAVAFLTLARRAGLLTGGQ